MQKLFGKAAHALKIQWHFSTSDRQNMWKVIKSITNYSKGNAECPRDSCLPDALNISYARSEASNTSPNTKFNCLQGGVPCRAEREEVKTYNHCSKPTTARLHIQMTPKAGLWGTSFLRCWWTFLTFLCQWSLHLHAFGIQTSYLFQRPQLRRPLMTIGQQHRPQ